jgi:hypothetical protein
MNSTKRIDTTYAKNYQHMCDDKSKNKMPLLRVAAPCVRMGTTLPYEFRAVS